MNVRIRIHTLARSKREIRFLLDKLVAMNMRKLASQPFPPLYESGVRYEREREDYNTAHPVEDWQAVDVLYRTKRGDCEDLAAWRCAELRLQGLDAHIRLTRRGRIWHVTVKVGDRVEDPSKVLGMKGSA